MAGQQTAAQLNNPWSIAIDTSGNIYIADYFNNRIRKVNTLGIISTIAGNGYGGFSGDNGPATLAELDTPAGVASDLFGNIYIADYGGNRVRKVDISGIITTIAGTGICAYSGEGVMATLAELGLPMGIATDNFGNVYIADVLNADDRIRKIDTMGLITTITGNGTWGHSGDGGMASAAQLATPCGVAINSSGEILIADYNNNRVRLISSIKSNVNSIVTVNYSIDVFPNPSASVLSITSTETIYSIAIANLIGQIVYCNSYHDKEAQLDVSGLPAGMYLVRINGAEVRKFVKE